MNIEIIGVNRSGDDPFNPLITAVNRLPWLQDTVADDTWGRWRVVYRDIQILDSLNRVHSVFNVTTHDLGLAANKAAIKQMFLAAATIVDSDKDTLPDDWEMLHFGNLSATASDDSDGDGYDNATEFAFGTSPRDPASRPRIGYQIDRAGGEPKLHLTIRRRAGGFPQYFMEQAPDVGKWSQGAGELVPAGSPRNLFDGSGTSEATYSIPLGGKPSSFFNVRFSR